MKVTAKEIRQMNNMALAACISRESRKVENPDGLQYCIYTELGRRLVHEVERRENRRQKRSCRAAA